MSPAQKILIFRLAASLAAIVVFLGIGFFLRWLFGHYLSRLAKKTKWKGDEVMLLAFRPWIIPLLLLPGFSMAAKILSLGEKTVGSIDRLLVALAIIFFTLFLAGLGSRLVSLYAEKSQATVPLTGLTRNLTRILILAVGILTLLHHLGISITPLITTLGIGGLAVALALQDTLGNLFAGIYLTINKQIRIGDYIKLDSGEEGYVLDTDWRSTRIRALANNLIIIPNAKLSQAIVTNYHLPEKEMSLLLPIGVAYGTDPDRVEKILVEEAKKAAQQVPGLLADPEPLVRFIPGFGDFSLNFTLICRVKEFVDQYLVQHELRKLIYRRFQAEGIEIPFPIRTVHLHQPKDS